MPGYDADLITVAGDPPSDIGTPAAVIEVFRKAHQMTELGVPACSAEFRSLKGFCPSGTGTSRGLPNGGLVAPQTGPPNKYR
ncbi:hypothetical protein [Nonomuraea sp. NPDC003709]|uniref:hypothetical protein n=1 Tax=Nonomuraea sp. NPDC003709 TaxID=3154450 RepID=UPI0033B1B817